MKTKVKIEIGEKLNQVLDDENFSFKEKSSIFSWCYANNRKKLLAQKDQTEKNMPNENKNSKE